MTTISRLTTAAFLVGFMCAVSSATEAKRVVVIGVDGMSPDGIQKADTPVLDRLIESGAHTFKARAVMPTSSSPNWASMIMGAGPEQHGITSNDWEPDKFETAPSASTPDGRFPTIFALLDRQKPDLKSAAVYDWHGFGRLFHHEHADTVRDTLGPKHTTNMAVKLIEEERPHFLFVHLDHVDHAGHEHGHGTPEYYRAVEEADSYIGQIQQALKEHDLNDETVLIITSDHGGKGKGHGGNSMAELLIPWIATGPGVAAGAELGPHINTYDTAATVAWLMGLEPHPAWVGRPVKAAFETE